MKLIRAVLPAILALLALLAYLSTYLVQEHESAVRLRLGQVVETHVNDQGLHLKWPMVENVRRFDSRIRLLSERQARFVTADKRNVAVDATLLWQVVDPARFFQQLGGDAELAARRLGELLRNELRGELGAHSLERLMSEARGRGAQQLRERLSQAAEPLGVRVVDVRVQRIDFPKEAREVVVSAMGAEQARLAREHRSQGRVASEAIRAEAERLRTQVLANARRDAERTRGEGEARASEIYAQAYSVDPEFFVFYRSLLAYRNSFDSEDDILILTPNSAFFRYFDQPRPAR